VFVPDLSKGVVLCLLSQLLFSVLYLFSHWMQPISGTDVFALRMVMTAAGLWLMMAWTLGLAAMPRFVQQFLTSPRRWLLVFLGGPAGGLCREPVTSRPPAQRIRKIHMTSC